MVHPKYWSLYSIWCAINRKSPEVLWKDDVKFYTQLPLGGSVVLDVGAYTGDTAELFLKNNAKKVICVEPNSSRMTQIFRRKIDHSKLEILIEPFSEKHLERADWDCAKIDCEGYETPMVTENWARHIRGRKVVIEAHNHFIAEGLKKYGFRVLEVYEPMMGLCIMRNW